VKWLKVFWLVGPFALVLLGLIRFCQTEYAHAACLFALAAYLEAQRGGLRGDL